jgi:hypothetical protein
VSEFLASISLRGRVFRDRPDGCHRRKTGRRPENVGSRFLFLLQSPPFQTISDVPANCSPNAHLSPEIGAWPIYSTSSFVNRISSVTIYKPLKTCCSVRWAKGTFEPVRCDWNALVSEMADSQGERTVVRHLVNPEPAVAATERQSLLLVGEACGMQRSGSMRRAGVSGAQSLLLSCAMPPPTTDLTTGRTTNEQG